MWSVPPRETRGLPYFFIHWDGRYSHGHFCGLPPTLHQQQLCVMYRIFCDTFVYVARKRSIRGNCCVVPYESYKITGTKFLRGPVRNLQNYWTKIVAWSRTKVTKLLDQNCWSHFGKTFSLYIFSQVNLECLF